MIPDLERIKDTLDERVDYYNKPSFIPDDPISIPHQYSLLQDIEITAFWTAILSWGLRKTIIQKAKDLFQCMDNAPYDFVRNHTESDRQRLLSFRHRTFQPTDSLYFLEYLQQYYRSNSTLETAFHNPLQKNFSVKASLERFHDVMFDSPVAPRRTRKHVSTPRKGASCKRLNMFLRWMVRSDNRGVDFGLWRTIDPKDLMIPLDVHVQRVALRLGLLKRDKSDWRSVEELTGVLRQLDPGDPVKYDFALFSIGVD